MCGRHCSRSFACMNSLNVCVNTIRQSTYTWGYWITEKLEDPMLVNGGIRTWPGAGRLTLCLGLYCVDAITRCICPSILLQKKIHLKFVTNIMLSEKRSSYLLIFPWKVQIWMKLLWMKWLGAYCFLDPYMEPLLMTLPLVTSSYHTGENGDKSS